MSWELLILLLFGLALAYIFLYSLVQLQLVILYRKSKSNNREIKDQGNCINWPEVTIQLPIYNERYVVERLIEKISKLDYPRDKLSVQILDDSTDETSDIIDRKVSELKEIIEIEVIRRENREGFKAGALATGLQRAKGEFLAIFDADFLPQESFLKETIVYFNNPKIGMVQTKWEHVNDDYSLLTKMQAFGLDAHFSVEQGGRNYGGHFINFNGTAGVWRKKAIEDSGGWQADTLTEDLDLSYRAQLNGWKFKFLESCGSPAELPAEINALKTQQYRWTKGAAECSRKNLMKVIRSKDFSISSKINAIFHLLNSSVFICISIASLLSVPVLFIKKAHPEWDGFFNIGAVFLTGFIFLMFFYWTSYRQRIDNEFNRPAQFIWKFPSFLSISMGLSLHNGLAAFEGLIGKKSAFIRTPKFNILRAEDTIEGNKYTDRKIGKLTFLEAILALYFILGCGVCFVFKDFGLLPFLMMLGFGYSYISAISFKHALKRN